MVSGERTMCMVEGECGFRWCGVKRAIEVGLSALRGCPPGGILGICIVVDGVVRLLVQEEGSVGQGWWRVFSGCKLRVKADR